LLWRRLNDLEPVRRLVWINEIPWHDLETARGCHIEIIMKDVSTVRYQPQRLWEWEKIAMQVA
jgi:hypothetical protein